MSRSTLEFPRSRGSHRVLEPAPSDDCTSPPSPTAITTAPRRSSASTLRPRREVARRAMLALRLRPGQVRTLANGLDGIVAAARENPSFS